MLLEIWVLSEFMSILDVCSLTASALDQSACDLSSLAEMMMGDFNTNEDRMQHLKLDETSRKEGISFHPAVFRQLPSDLPSNKNDQIRLLGVSALALTHGSAPVAK